MALADSKKQTPDFSFEMTHIKAGKKCIAGVDEAGRGPWAGPVVAAAVILDRKNIPEGLNDSKKLSPVRRDELFDQIVANAQYGVGIVQADEIDRINILQATMKAMAKALAALPQHPDVALIDGTKAPQINCASETIKRGDGRSLSIAAASIIAKVTRDELMIALDQKYPVYGFARHKGYGTAIHAQALAEFGPCPAHRKSFAPIRVLLSDSKNPSR